MKKDDLIERGILQQFVLGLCDQEDEALVRSEIAYDSELKDVTNDMEIMLTEMISMHMNMPCAKTKKSCLDYPNNLSHSNDKNPKV